MPHLSEKYYNILQWNVFDILVIAVNGEDLVKRKNILDGNVLSLCEKPAVWNLAINVRNTN